MGRVISTVDLDARHGHRSRRDRYDGYKLHLAVDADSDLLTAAEASLATTPDAVMLPSLLAADPVAEILGHTHYGGAQTRRELASHRVELVTPVPPSPAPKGLITKDDSSSTSWRAPSPAPPARSPPSAFSCGWPSAGPFGEACRGSLASRCTRSTRGRFVKISADEELLGPARASRWTEEFRERYGERSRIERKAAQIKYRSPKVPWGGLVKADAWLKLKVAAMNPDRLGRLGLVRG